MRATVWHLAKVRFGECWERATALVAEHRAGIERLANVLLHEKHRLTGDEIEQVIREGQLRETVRNEEAA